MDIIKWVIKCAECSATLHLPILLPCGLSVCLKHLENIKNLRFFCKSCDKDHKIEVNQRNVNKALDILVNANVENLYLGPEYNAAVEICNQFDQTISDSETVKNDPLNFVKQTIDALKHRTESIQESHKLILDEYANKIFQQLNNYEKECIQNVDSSDLKIKIAKIDETISTFKDDLIKRKRTLNDLSSDEVERKRIKEDSKKSDFILNCDLFDLKNDLLVKKLDHHLTTVLSFGNISLSFDFKK